MITALYRGNSSPGQLIDSSSNGNNLILSGVVSSPSSPTPPEGDRWLAYKPLGILTNYLESPTTVYNQAQGMFGFYFTQEFNPTINTMLIRIRQNASNLIDIFLNFPSGIIRTYLFDGSLLYDFSTPIVSSLIPNKVVQRWDSSGTKFYVNDILVGSSAAFPTALPSPIAYIAGDPTSTASSIEVGGIDLFQFSDDPNEVYPPINVEPFFPVTDVGLGGAVGPANLESKFKKEGMIGRAPMRINMDHRKRKFLGN